VGSAPPPAPPSERLADTIFAPAEMERARRQLRAEHGGGRWTKVMVDRLEARPGSGEDAYAWDAALRHGGDINRLVIATEGEGRFGEEVEDAEVQALWSRAVGPYTDLQLGVRQDLAGGGKRTWAVAGFETLAPYWFEIEGHAYLSDEGDLTAELEASYDLRLTQRLVLEPRAEVTLAAEDAPELGLSAGVSNAELGLRLRWEIRREFAPYVGVHHEQTFGDDDAQETRAVIGLRAWF
jgi:copper resistance protein B